MARIHTLSVRAHLILVALVRLGAGRFADLRVAVRVLRAVLVALASHRFRFAAVGEILRIALVPLQAPAAGRVATPADATLSIRTARDARTNIATLGFTVRLPHTLGSLRTVGVPFALGCSLASRRLVRIAHQTGRTRAPVRPTAVPALGIRTARSLAAEIDQRAAHLRITGKTGLTVAHLAMVFGRTERIRPARSRPTGQARNLARMVIAQLVRRTVLIDGALDPPAHTGRITEEPLLTLAHGRMGTGNTIRIPSAQCPASAARIATLGPTARVGHAHLIGITVLVRAALELLRADPVVAVLEVGTGRV
uniref:Putative secreted protein n=1 Tax=Anopheles triannulatus TaxID=58253 RepID=A0A2M4B146_9DIPT